MESLLEKSFLAIIARRKKEIDEGKTKNIRDITSKKINGKETCYHEMKCEAISYIQQTNNPEKYFILERWERKKIVGTPAIQTLKVGDIEYRICYYIISRKPETKRVDKWIYGQFSPMISYEDLFTLIKKAKFEKTILE